MDLGNRRRTVYPLLSETRQGNEVAAESGEVASFFFMFTMIHFMETYPYNGDSTTKGAQAIPVSFEKIVIIAPVIAKTNPIIPNAIYSLFSTIFTPPLSLQHRIAN